MRYNLFISNFTGKFNILDISEEQLDKTIKAYMNGTPSLTLSGEKYIFDRINELKIFTFEPDGPPDETLKYYKNNINFRVKQIFGSYLPVRTLSLMGKDITYEIIGDSEFGEKSLVNSESQIDKRMEFVNISRIEELKSVKSIQFDLVRLVRLCEEINDSYRLRNFMSVAIIGRAILDHIPPVFNYTTFDSVANNYGGIDKNRSFKKIMLHLNGSLRNIADKFLHQVIRSSETLPNETQVNFSQELDVLLDEIVRILKK